MKKYLVFLSLLLTHYFLLLNLRFEAWPEMLTYPYLLGKGFLLYRDIINPYVPGFLWTLQALFSFVEVSVSNLQGFTWVLIGLTDILLFWVARQRYGLKAALLALGFFVAFQPLLDGNGLWFDLALTPLLLLAFFFQSPWWLAGTLLVKQSVVVLFPLFLKRWKTILTGVVLGLGITSIVFLAQGTLNDYWFWAFEYAFFRFPFLPGHKDFGNLYLWGVALLPFIPVVWLTLKETKNVKEIFQPSKPFSWMVLSAFFIFPRFGLFHLQPALAFAALSLAGLFKELRLSKMLKLPAFSLFAIGYVLVASLAWFRHGKLYWQKSVRFFEPEIITAAESLKQQTEPEDLVFTLNAPDQILVLADRLPPKPWVDTFPWYLEVEGMQERVIQSFRDQNVAFVLFSPYQNQGKYVPGSYIPAHLNEFIQEAFQKALPLTADIQLLTRL